MNAISFRSLRDALATSFPPPEFLVLPAAGLDISSRSAKALLLSEGNGHLALSRYAQVEIPEGIIQDGDITDSDALVEILRRLRSRYSLRYVHASLPEKKAFLYQATMPKEKDIAALRQAIESELEEHVPLPPSETYFDFEILPNAPSPSEVRVAVTAYARRIIESYTGVLERAGLTPLSLEIESQALARALVPAHVAGAVMIVDFGKYATRAAFVVDGAVAFTTTVDIGGDSLTRAIMKLRSITEAEAEKLKNEQGLVVAEDGTDLSEALMITITVLKDELLRHLSFWNERPENAESARVAQVYLCGGNANLKGLAEYLAAGIRLPVSVANVWENAFPFDAYIPDLQKSDSLGYATAIGLALKSFRENT